jgi:glutaminase
MHDLGRRFTPDKEHDMKTQFTTSPRQTLLAIVSLSLALNGVAQAAATAAGRQTGERLEQPKEQAPPTTAIPSSDVIERAVKKAYEAVKGDNAGKNADYIPVLAKVPSDLFGIAVVTVGGKIYKIGDVDHAFSIQSCSKVFTLCHVLQESGDKVILEKIGVEPTGEKFNSIQAIEEGDGRADNPLVNAGAIATVSLIKASTATERWEKLLNTYDKFAGERLKLLDEVYKSEAETNFRNRGIANVLLNSEHLYAEPMQCVDVYTKQCSVGVTAKQLAVMGATLANYGVNPITKEQCMDPQYIPRVLAVMMSCGFYDESGTWAWGAGLPAKTGVGGGIVAVVPGKMAIVGFSPRLNDAGNSVRGAKAILSIDQDLGLNLFGATERPRQLGVR